MAPERRSYPTKLPSMGKLYGDLTKDGEVEIYSIRVFEEKMLASGVGSPTDRINRLVASCLKTAIPVNDLLIVDRFFLMFQLAAMSYDPTRNLLPKCPACRTVNTEVKVDLSKDFQVHYLESDIDEPIDVELPLSKSKVAIKFLRVKDENEILSITEKLRRPNIKSKGASLSKDDIYTIRLVSSVVTIDGKEMRLEEKVAWADTLEGRDSEALRNALEEYDFGVDPTYQVKCSNCQEEFQAILPAEDFFRL